MTKNLPVVYLGIRTQHLISSALNLGMVEEAKQLRQIDDVLRNLSQKSQQFDFIQQVARGRTLLVGEGNFSFARSLLKDSSINPLYLTATVPQDRQEASKDMAENAESLKKAGAAVLWKVDATDLGHTFGSWRFETIVFQFPHSGSREPIEGRNPNFILVRDFLTSAYHQLLSGGAVLISAIDNPHYQGAFQFEEAAKIAGFLPPSVYPFNMRGFQGYSHVVTAGDSSALEAKDKLCTWVFRK